MSVRGCNSESAAKMHFAIWAFASRSIKPAARTIGAIYI
jgi:hypothetical protein